jgi:hypothetical protein
MRRQLLSAIREMQRMRKISFTILMVSAAVTGLILSGCGSGGGDAVSLTSSTTTTTPPATPPAACIYTYDVWGACQPDNTQTRTVATAAPAGCTGTPILSQSCVYTPPPLVTVADVTASCTLCHDLTVNTTVFKSGTGGYSDYIVVGRTASEWLSTVDAMVGTGAILAPGATAQDYASFLAAVP